MVKDKGQSSFLVVGVVRDCAAAITPDVNRLRAAIGKVKDLRWLLVESDSRDQTLDVLERQKQTVEGFEFLSLGPLAETMDKRTERIAHCRNAYLDQIVQDPRYGQVDYVVIADFDGLNQQISSAAMESCWETDVEWDMCAANQAGPYYDIWALRHPEWSPNDCWAQFRYLRANGVGHERALEACVHARMITIAPDHDWIEVESAFGGLAIYRKDALLGCRYDGLSEDGQEVCEHVPLHAQMRARGRRLFINPSLINAGYTEASEELRLGRSVSRKVKNLVKSAIGGVAGPDQLDRVVARVRAHRDRT